MNNILNEYFKIPENEHIKEKVMLTRITMSVIIIIACLVAMSVTAYGFFSHSTSTNNHSISAAKFSLEIKDDAGNAISGAYVCGAKENDMHSFTLKASGNANTGYCKISVVTGDVTKTYYTTQLFKDSTPEKPSEITIKIQAVSGSIIKFSAEWGTSTLFVSDPTALYGTATKTTIYHSASSRDAEILHTVLENETIEDILAKYYLSLDVFLAYNESTEIVVVAGDVVKIPPSSWKIPAENGGSNGSEDAVKIESGGEQEDSTLEDEENNGEPESDGEENTLEQ